VCSVAPLHRVGIEYADTTCFVVEYRGLYELE
jgi:hypothetical protein